MKFGFLSSKFQKIFACGAENWKNSSIMVRGFGDLVVNRWYVLGDIMFELSVIFAFLRVIQLTVFWD
ncbi:unnamed protein product [Meloidogyne enterolobii]|uniref:Uncharacterized protein n=1 Tax=Meloidogyne enterolobii TaxID=390850 RepID=A0ACB0XSC6_MELEN